MRLEKMRADVEALKQRIGPDTRSHMDRDELLAMTPEEQLEVACDGRCTVDDLGEGALRILFQLKREMEGLGEFH